MKWRTPLKTNPDLHVQDDQPPMITFKMISLLPNGPGGLCNLRCLPSAESRSVKVMSVEVLDVEEHVDSAVLICRISYKPDVIACLI